MSDEKTTIGEDLGVRRVNGYIIKSFANLRGAYLRGADLYGANLYGADLYGANLRGADLYGADLYGADLRGADLYGANLRGANLYGANLYGAYLRGAYLRGANLYGANLRGADLRGADLYGAYLRGADLRGADLRGANLYGADLRGANLYGADLYGADLRGADLGDDYATKAWFKATRILPDEGSIVAWKALRSGRVAKLLIPEDAERSHAFGRKCRASKAVVLGIYDRGGNVVESGRSSHDPAFYYTVGATVTPVNGFGADWREECAPGIHFFITRAEAEEYGQNM